MRSTVPSALEILAQLVSVNSVNPNYPDGVNELQIAEYVTEFFAKLGIETWRQEVYPGRPNVLAKIPGKDATRRIILEAHLDTVSAVGMTIEPWVPQVRDGNLYGRGACDTKAGMAAMMHAIAAIWMDSTTPPCEVIFAATIDEEFSYRGVVALCNSLAPGPVDPQVLATSDLPTDPISADCAIVAEPTELRMVTASKGLVRWKMETLGRAAHSAKPHLGINAIEHMAELIAVLRDDTERLTKVKHRLLGSATCSIGVIRGGTQVNLVPDRCEIEIDRRLLPGECCEQVWANYQMLAEDLTNRTLGMQVITHPPMLKDHPLETRLDSSVVQVMANVLRKQNLDATPVGVPFCSDASKFGKIGIPTIIFGPGSIDQAHTANEFVSCDQVLEAAEVYRQFILDFQ